MIYICEDCGDFYDSDLTVPHGEDPEYVICDHCHEEYLDRKHLIEERVNDRRLPQQH